MSAGRKSPAGRGDEVIDIYVEAGTKRTFAGAIEWPGWCRAGQDEAAAADALIDYGTRYEAALAARGIDFTPAAETAHLHVVERLPGTPTTDFGAPGEAPSADDRVVVAGDLERLESILEAAWAALDRAREAAPAELAKGPRGGGRDREAIYGHVLDAEIAYLSKLGRNSRGAAPWTSERVATVRADILAGIAAAARGEIPLEGPRGGRRWSARYFVRRAAWHALDHAWEIEDRSGPVGR